MRKILIIAALLALVEKLLSLSAKAYPAAEMVYFKKMDMHLILVLAF
jgi:hypothetical protein